MANNRSRDESNAAMDRMFGDPDLIADADRVAQRARDRRSPAMFAWVGRRRAAAAERKRREETATIREAGEEAKSRPRSNSAYGGRKSKTLRRHRRGKKTVKRTRRR